MPEGELAFGDTNPLAAKIREAIGAGPFEQVQIVTPQFTRTNGRQVTVFPTGPAFLDALKTAPTEILADCCMVPWDEESKVWLFPGEWYPHIPEGYMVTDINGNDEPFEKGKTDDDIRFGCLSFGFRRS